MNNDGPPLSPDRETANARALRNAMRKFRRRVAVTRCQLKLVKAPHTVLISAYDTRRWRRPPLQVIMW